MKRLLSLAILLLVVSCVRDGMYDSPVVDYSAKIVGSAEGAAQDILLVKLNNAEHNLVIEGATIEPMFPINGSELDRWVKVRLAEGSNLEAMATTIVMISFLPVG